MYDAVFLRFKQNFLFVTLYVGAESGALRCAQIDTRISRFSAADKLICAQPPKLLTDPAPYLQGTAGYVNCCVAFDSAPRTCATQLSNSFCFASAQVFPYT